MILDGKLIAERVKAEVKQQVEAFVSTHGRAPQLHVVLVGDDPASHVYVRNKGKAAKKVGIDGATHTLPADVSQEDLDAMVRELNARDDVDGLLVQLPLPKGLSEQRVLDLIDASKDVDGLHPLNSGLISAGRETLVACTPQGCMRLIAESGVRIEGKSAVVVGRSHFVGKPVAQLLLAEHATVTQAHSRTRDLDSVCRRADILVVAVGRPMLVKGDWIKPGAVVIDVGINRLDDGRIVGDVDFASAQEHAAAITPVPGGVGPLTIAYLLHNTVQAAYARENCRLLQTKLRSERDLLGDV
jgi:methylenetetrahydrofolate dehydrogenase (NADP+)/methenyltetrahydrofolate cyclohydrolase